MESSAQAFSNMPLTQPKDYNSWIEENYQDNPVGKWFAGDNGVFSWFANKLTGKQDRAKNEYNRYVEGINKLNEQRSLANARAYNEWYDSTKYQRAVADLRKAGLNPWLALNSGFGTESASSATNSSAKGVEYSLAEKTGSMIGALLGALAKVIAG